MLATHIYCYCVVHSARRPAVGRAPAGVPGAAPLEAIEFGRDFWLVAAEVPGDTYGREALRASLADASWVSSVALAHNSVIEFFARARTTTTIPLKLFTLFSTRERAAADMRAARRTIAAVARRVAGCEEWGVRVLPPARAAASPSRTEAPSTGAAFLAAKKQARDDARTRVVQAAESADRVFRSLQALARAAERREDVPAGAAAPPLLDAAFLVPGRRAARFRAAARRAAAECADAGAELTLTGPWPAYSFVQRAGSRG